MHDSNTPQHPSPHTHSNQAQHRRLIEYLVIDGQLPPSNADHASLALGVYPNKKNWFDFFDRGLLITSVMTLVLALVFFVAYNWSYMGKMGKFALVEGALAATIIAYVVLVLWRRFELLQRLLLLVASIITGSLLALFGQVYQTGADTWQLFANWALLITPLVIVARLPILWLLWLALINAAVKTYGSVGGFGQWHDANTITLFVVTVINITALMGWLWFTPHSTAMSQHPRHNQQGDKVARSTLLSDNKISQHWSTYIVALMATYNVTFLAVLVVNGSTDGLWTVVLAATWLTFITLMYYRFRKHQIDILMLLFMCASLIATVMFWLGRQIIYTADVGGFLILGLLLIAMSSAAVVWLRNLNRVNPIEDTPLSPQEVEADVSAVDASSANRTDSRNALQTLSQLGMLTANPQTPLSANAIDNIDNDFVDALSHDDDMPWFLHVFLGMSGMMAGTLLMAFLGLLFSAIFKDKGGVIAGSILLLISITMFRRTSLSDSTFMSSLAFAISIAGQSFMLIGLVFMGQSAVAVAWIFMLLQIALVIAIPNFLHQLVSSFIALSCLLWLLTYYQAPEFSAGTLALIASVCLLQRYQYTSFVAIRSYPAFLALTRAVGYASAALLLLISVYLVTAEHNRYLLDGVVSQGFEYHYGLAQGVLLLVSGYAVSMLLRRYHVPLLSPTGLVIISMLAVMAGISLYVSGLLATSMVIVLAMATGRGILMKLGMTALIGYIFWYYYQLDTSLLVKSASMLAVGVGLLLTHWILTRYFGNRTDAPIATQSAANHEGHN